MTQIALNKIYSGKVRDLYDIDEKSMLMVDSDRLSAFDVILEDPIPTKGEILTRISNFWFQKLAHIMPNHFTGETVFDVLPKEQAEQLQHRAVVTKKLTPVKIEAVVRGYLAGGGYKEYQTGGRVCGIRLPADLKLASKLPEAIFTPSTKAAVGDHDENISYEKSIDVIEKLYPGKGKEYATKLRDYTITLYTKCADYAKSKGIIIADTKFEFGLDENDNVIIGDEMLTPDSSRFWPLEGYMAGQSQPSYDKQFVRDWLKANPDSDYLLPDGVIAKTVDKYKEAFFMLTGKKFA